MTNKRSFFLALTVVLFAGSAFAQETVAVAAQNDGIFEVFKSNLGLFALAAGLGLGLAAFGGAISQGRAAIAALEGIARNPGASGKIFTPFILSLALIETLVLFTFVIAIMIVGNIGGSIEQLMALVQ